MFRRLLLSGLALAWAGSASAQPPQAERPEPPPHGRMHPRLFISPSGEPFRGGDGLAAWFAQADADHDGAVTLEEFQADALRFFNTLDTNHDGRVDGFEIQAYERDIAPEITQLDFDQGPGAEEARDGAGEPRPERGRGEGGGGGGRRGHGRMGRGGAESAPQAGGRAKVRGAGRDGAARYSLINEPEPVANADADMDSRVTLAEWRRATLGRFQALDRAKTGRLTLEGLRTPGNAR